jgi:hypothetical protein
MVIHAVENGNNFRRKMVIPLVVKETSPVGEKGQSQILSDIAGFKI